MGFLDGLSSLVSGATDVASGYEGGVVRKNALDRADAIEAIKVKRQTENDNIENALKKAQTQRALQNPTHLIWKLGADGTYQGYPTTDETTPTPTSPATPQGAAAAPVAPGPTKPSDQGPATANSPKRVTPIQGGSAPPKAATRIDPNSAAGITADSTKAANHARVRQQYPAPARTPYGASGAGQIAQEQKANRAFVLKRIGTYMNPQYDPNSQGILKAPPLSRADAVKKAVQDAKESGQFPHVYMQDAPAASKPAPATQKAPQGHSRDIGGTAKQSITSQEAQALKALGHSDQDIAAHYNVSG